MVAGAAGIGPGLGVADRDLAAVGEARLQRGVLAPVDHRDGMARAGEIPRRRRPDHARTQHRHLHRIASCSVPADLGSLSSSTAPRRDAFC